MPPLPPFTQRSHLFHHIVILPLYLIKWINIIVTKVNSSQVPLFFFLQRRHKQKIRQKLIFVAELEVTVGVVVVVIKNVM